MDGEIEVFLIEIIVGGWFVLGLTASLVGVREARLPGMLRRLRKPFTAGYGPDYLGVSTNVVKSKGAILAYRLVLAGVIVLALLANWRMATDTGLGPWPLVMAVVAYLLLALWSVFVLISFLRARPE